MIAEWTLDANQLLNQATEWVQHQAGWKVQPETSYKDLPNSSDSLEVRSIRIETPAGERIHLEPLGRKGDGRTIVEMYAWPTLIRVWLQHSPGQPDWEIVTDSGIPFRRAWNEENFVQLVHDLSVLP